METILDRSETYLKIFTSNIEIDNKLPKWKNIKKEKQNQEEVKNKITFSQFVNLNGEEFNIYVGNKVINNFNNNKILMNFINEDVLFDELVNVESNDSSIKQKHKFFKRIKKFFKKYLSKKVYQFDVLAFFENVKGLLKDSRETYIQRIEPYLIALEEAQQMGQTALVDKLTSEIFINKYESILYAANFYQKITEEQLVNFVKKSEKGIQLCYIKNFARPIPQSVINIKKRADELLVFDNYCVLYYDNKTKSYQKTKEELELERRKKSDPILFGMVHGSRNLYYVADWIDEYCDLTLEEFLKVSGIDKKHIQIDKEIKL